MAHCLFILLNQRGNPVEPNRIRSLDRSCPFGITTLFGCNKTANSKVWFRLYYIILSRYLVKSRPFLKGRDKNFAAQKSPACPKAGGASARSADWGNLISSKNSQFVADNVAAGIKPSQTFTIILPNLIHKSKKRNLKKR